MQDRLGFTALMCACQEGHSEVADLLIEKGAMVEYHNKVRLLVQCHCVCMALIEWCAQLKTTLV